MENPNRTLWRNILLVVFGIAIGLVPGVIKIGEMRDEVAATQDSTAKELATLRKLLAERSDLADKETALREQEKQECYSTIAGDGARTILVDLNHPYGQVWAEQNILGVRLALPQYSHPEIRISPIWVVPRAVKPQVVDGILAGVYTHIWPDGRTDGWQTPSRAE